MDCKRAGYAILGALILSWAAVSQALAQAPSTAKASTDGYGDDVVAAGRRWAAGDSQGRKSLEDLAQNGRADAQEVLGEILSTSGIAKPPEPEMACRYFQMAASSRGDALHSLAFCAEKGIGGAPDLPRAAALYAQAAAKGYAKANCALGNLYIAGQGVPKDVRRGADLCRVGAEGGDRDAQTDLGNLYLRGVGVPHDMVQARLWYEKAAAQGQPNAQFVLGQIYWNGDGVAADQAKASQLLAAAYEKGRLDAAPFLGGWFAVRWMAIHPSGDTSLLDEAIRWDEAAAKSAQNQAALDAARQALEFAQALKDASSKAEKK